jgi:biotin operon repressor
MGEIFNKSYADFPSKAEAEKAFSSFKHRWYERLVIAKEISALAFRLCYLLKPNFNLKYGGKAWPSQGTLAEQLGVTRKHVNMLINELVRHGHLISQRGQHGCAYYMVLKELVEDELRWT